MDVLISKISKCANFEKTGRRICQPLVIHCVPGAGKSTVIRELLSLDTRFIAFTFGRPDPISLSCRGIAKPSPLSEDNNSLVLIDEYTEGDFSAYKPIAVFGDPLQSSGKFPILEAHFINSTTSRFGKNTCALLRSFKFDIYSDLEDEVFIGGLYTEELGSIVIAVEDCVKKLLKAHNVPYLCLDKVRGAEFKSVTFCCSEDTIPDCARSAFFVALTRHKQSLRILSPNAAFTSC